MRTVLFLTIGLFYCAVSGPRAETRIPEGLAHASAPLADASPTAPAESGFRGGRTSSFYRLETAPPSVPGLSDSHGGNGGRPTTDERSQRHQNALYSSTSGVGDPVPIFVSGQLLLPKPAAPAGGWPIVAWEHGTTGIAAVCAPSWRGWSSRDRAYLNHWLDEGFAVVATDYQGLGTPGPHPYLYLQTGRLQRPGRRPSASEHVRRYAAKPDRIGWAVPRVGRSGRGLAGPAIFSGAPYNRRGRYRIGGGVRDEGRIPPTPAPGQLR